MFSPFSAPRHLLIAFLLPTFAALISVFYLYPIWNLLTPTEQNRLFYTGLAFICLTVFIAYTFVIRSTKGMEIDFADGFIITLFSLLGIYFFNADPLNYIFDQVPRWKLDWKLGFVWQLSLYPLALFGVWICAKNSRAKDASSHTLRALVVATILTIYWIAFVNLFGFEHENNVQRIRFFTFGAILTVATAAYFLMQSLLNGYEKNDGIFSFFDNPFVRVLVVLVIPVLTWYFNHSPVGGIEKHALGDFSDRWAWVLLVLNGVVLLFPQSENKFFQFIILIISLILLPVSLIYFFILLPYLPIGILTILFFIGIIAVNPLFMLYYHLKQILLQIQALNQIIPKFILSVTFLFIGLLPTLYLRNLHQQKATLENLLAYAYAPKAIQLESFDQNQFKSILFRINRNQAHNSFVPPSPGTPILDQIFNLVVTERKTYSQSTSNFLSMLYLGQPIELSIDQVFFLQERFKDAQSSLETVLQDFNVETNFDEKQNCYKSSLTLSFKNPTKNQNSAFISQFYVPQGVFVNDFKMQRNRQKVSANLVIDDLELGAPKLLDNLNKHPILARFSYMDIDNLRLNLYHFKAQEEREIKIGFTHFKDFELSIGGRTISISAPKGVLEAPQTANLHYISKDSKQNFKSYQRKPYYHFIVDCSKSQKGYASLFKNMIDFKLKERLLDTDLHKISFVDYEIRTFPLDVKENWVQRFDSLQTRGGFFLDAAIKSALINSYEHTDQFPVFVVLSASKLNLTVLRQNFKALQFTFPESPYFYQEYMNGRLYPHSLTGIPQVLADTTGVTEFKTPVLVYPKSKRLTLVNTEHRDEYLPVAKLRTYESKSAMVPQSPSTAAYLWEEMLWNELNGTPESLQQYLRKVKSSGFLMPRLGYYAY